MTTQPEQPAVHTCLMEPSAVNENVETGQYDTLLICTECGNVIHLPGVRIAKHTKVTGKVGYAVPPEQRDDQPTPRARRTTRR